MDKSCIRPRNGIPALQDSQNTRHLCFMTLFKCPQKFFIILLYFFLILNFIIFYVFAPFFVLFLLNPSKTQFFCCHHGAGQLDAMLAYIKFLFVLSNFRLVAVIPYSFPKIFFSATLPNNTIILGFTNTT